MAILVDKKYAEIMRQQNADTHNELLELLALVEERMAFSESVTRRDIQLRNALKYATREK